MGGYTEEGGCGTKLWVISKKGERDGHRSGVGGPSRTERYFNIE